jgi:DNA primase
MELDRLIEEINSKLDILNVIGRYVKLKKAGRNYLGLCPFHAEKTPSFTVSPDKGMFYCFGCHTGGNMVTFVQKADGLTFKEALVQLANEAGVEIPELRKGPDRSPDYEIMDAVQTFFRDNFAKNPVPLDYLEHRGLSRDIITKFQVGFAPQDGHILTNLLKSKNFDLAKAHTLSVLSKKDSDYFSYMRGRITFPIYDSRGRIIAFGGRVMDDQEPKYLNSASTPIFDKGKNFFAYHLAKSTIQKNGRIIIVEGYMDAVSMHQSGFSETVASLGTAFTPDHASIIRRLGADAYLFFDSDDAGKKATISAIKICFETGLNCKVIKQDIGKDPDDLAKHGQSMVEEAIAKAKDPIDFAISYFQGQTNEPETPALKSRIAKAVMEISNSSPDSIVKSEYLKLISDRLKLSLTNLSKKSEIKPKLSLSVVKARENFEMMILRMLISNDTARAAILPKMTVEYFDNDLCKRVAQFMFANIDNSGKIHEIAVNEENAEILPIIARISVEQGDDEDIESFIEHILLDIEDRRSIHLRNKAASGELLPEELADYQILQRKRQKVEDIDGRNKR